MPGASLWLVPREDNPFTKTAQELISETVPSNFASALEGSKKVHFAPHVTVTSGIDAQSTYERASSPQAWLDGLALPEFKKEFDELLLELDTLEAGDARFQKLVIRLLKNDNIVKFAAWCRREAV